MIKHEDIHEEHHQQAKDAVDAVLAAFALNGLPFIMLVGVPQIPGKPESGGTYHVSRGLESAVNRSTMAGRVLAMLDEAAKEFPEDDTSRN